MVDWPHGIVGSSAMQGRCRLDVPQWSAVAVMFTQFFWSSPPSHAFALPLAVPCMHRRPARRPHTTGEGKVIAEWCMITPLIAVNHLAAPRADLSPRLTLRWLCWRFPMPVSRLRRAKPDSSPWSASRRKTMSASGTPPVDDASGDEARQGRKNARAALYPGGPCRRFSSAWRAVAARSLNVLPFAADARSADCKFSLSG